MDISEQGLCLYSPGWLQPKSTIEIAIDVSGQPDSIVRGDVWHARREQLKGSQRKIWVIGVMLEKSDDAYVKLLGAAGVAPEAGPEKPLDPTRLNKQRPVPNPTSAPKPRATQASKSRPKSTGGMSPNAAATPLRQADLDTVDPRVFRVRIQARTGPRTRLLTITADSSEQAQGMATRDLGAEWRIVGVIES